MIDPGDVILFQGDSITDCGRAREDTAANSMHAMGAGYAQRLAGRMLSERPGDELQFYNRGIGGNRVVDLYARWKIDALNLSPDLLSIHIGINDTWHEFGSRNGVEVGRYEMIYRELLKWTRQVLPEVKLVLCEPFYTMCGAVTEAWVPEIKARQEVVRRLAAEFHAAFVPWQQTFDAACEQAPPAYWALDGVHPTPAGHHRVAQTWYDTVVNHSG